MIRNEKEYQEAVRRLHAEKDRMAQHRKKLEEMELSSDEVKRALDPMIAFHEQLVEEVESYERLKRGEFWELTNFEGIGQLLIALRIASGTTQRQLASRLGVSESQISRDERNEYYGVSVNRVSRILEALKAEIRSVVSSVKVPVRKSKTVRRIEGSVRLHSTPIMAAAASFQPPQAAQIVANSEDSRD